MHTYTAPGGTVRPLGDLTHAHPKIHIPKITTHNYCNMNNAELYQGNNNLQKRDALDCLEEYASKMKWKRDGNRVIDIGCGDGSVTVKLLKEFIPRNFEKLLGCDISEKMVMFANDHHGDLKTQFTILDIEGNLPEDMKCSFDHAFSFYTLHWIKDQEAAFCNIYDMLSDGGQCLLTLLGHNPVFDVYRILAETSKWAGWLRGVERFISPYHDSQNPEKEIRHLMERIGYDEIYVTCQEKIFVYDSSEAVKKAVQAVDPFSMPKHVFDEFILDYLDVVRDMKLIDDVNNNKPACVRSNYKLIVVFGTKPTL